MKIINHILDNPNDVDFDISSMIHKNMKASAETISKSINGNLSKPQADKMRVCFQHYDSIET